MSLLLARHQNEEARLRALAGSFGTILCFGSRAPLARRWPGFGFAVTVFCEFRRAIAAEQRYDELRRRDAAALALEGVARTEIPRCIFEEFYSLTPTKRPESAVGPSDQSRLYTRNHRALGRRYRHLQIRCMPAERVTGGGIHGSM